VVRGRFHGHARNALHVAHEVRVLFKALGEFGLDLLDLGVGRTRLLLENGANIVLDLLHDVLVGEHGHICLLALNVRVVQHARLLAVAVVELIPPQALEF